MLSRRHLRVKVLQALYSCYQSLESCDFAKCEKELFRGIEKIYELYLILINLLPELAEQERIYLADKPARYLVSDKKEVVYSLQQNAVVKCIAESSALKSKNAEHKISWQQDTETLRKIFNQLRNTDEYINYVTVAEHDFIADVEFCNFIIKKFVKDSEFFQAFVEEKSMYWAESFEFAVSMVKKTIKTVNAGDMLRLDLLPMYKDEADDKNFMSLLFQNTLKNNAYFESLIQKKTINWEVERIAVVDVILLKMALCEVLFLENIPVKVSINEYLEVAKEFSTPASSMFINGIIDKLIIDLKNENKVVKTGRGLVE